VLGGTLPAVALHDEKLPIKMLNDRLLVRIPDKDGERRSSGGILIPATAQISKRLVWAEVVALGQNVRSAEVGDRVLFSPEDRYEVEVGGSDYIMLRERDIHAVAASRIEASTGLYLQWRSKRLQNNSRPSSTTRRVWWSPSPKTSRPRLC
jgi:chaperonin GroES